MRGRHLLILWSLCAPAAAAEPHPVREILYRDGTYLTGPLTIDAETASFLLARYTPAAGDSAGRATNVPRSLVDYVVYRGYAVRYADGQPAGHTSAVHETQRLYEHLLYPSLAFVALGTYHVQRYRAAEDRIAAAERNRQAQIARRHRKDRERIARQAVLALAAGTIGLVVTNTATVPVLRLGDGTVVRLQADGRFVTRHRAGSVGLGARLQVAGL